MDNEQDDQQKIDKGKINADNVDVKNVGNENSDDSKENVEKTFTKEDVERIVSERLKREKEKAEADKAEAKRLAKMDADQKKQYEIDKANKRAEEAEAKLARLEMRGQARSMLSEANINASDDDLDLIVTDNAETTKANVDKLKAIIQRERENVRKELLAGNTPKITGNNTKVVTKQQFDVMSSKQRTNLYHENPELFKKLTGGI